MTRADDEDHLQNLAEVHRHLQLHGLRMQKSECHFWETSVIFLWHQINLEGLHAAVDKVEAMVRAPIPRLLNYYQKTLSNLASLLQPMNSLL